MHGCSAKALPRSLLFGTEVPVLFSLLKQHINQKWEPATKRAVFGAWFDVQAFCYKSRKARKAQKHKE